MIRFKTLRTRFQRVVGASSSLSQPVGLISRAPNCAGLDVVSRDSPRRQGVRFSHAPLAGTGLATWASAAGGRRFTRSWRNPSGFAVSAVRSVGSLGCLRLRLSSKRGSASMWRPQRRRRRYLGQCITKRCSREWVQTTEKNRRFGQLCIDGFGNKKWDKVYPASLAASLPTLASTNPSFPGVRERCVLACQLEKAIKISDGS